MLSGEQPPLDGRVLSVNGATALLRTPTANHLPATGAPVRVEGDDALLLGEISSVRPEADQWTVILDIAHSLSSLAELERLNRALLGKQTSVPSLRSPRE